jgi:hypothetical protein
MNFEKLHFKMVEKFKMAARPEFSIIQSNFIKNFDLKTSIHKKNGGVIQDGATNHCFILSGLAQPFLNRF